MGLFDKLKKNVSSAVKDAVSDSFGDTINELTSSFKNVRSIVDEIRSEGASMLGANSLTNSLAGLKQTVAKPGQTMIPKQRTAQLIIETVKKGTSHLPGAEVTIDDDGDIRVLRGRGADGSRPIVYWLYVEEGYVMLDAKMTDLPEGIDMSKALDLECFPNNDKYKTAVIDKNGKLHIRIPMIIEKLKGENGVSKIKSTFDLAESLWNTTISSLDIRPEATVFKAEDLLKVGKIISDDATADSDGDVKVVFPADDSFNIRRTVWLMLGPERLTVQMAMHSPCDNGKSRRALDSMSLGAGVSADVSDDGVVRFNYRIVVDKNSDLAAVSYKTMQAVTLLGKHTADFCRAAGHDYVNRKLRMTTDVLVDLLKKNGVREYEVDSDGDVRADYSKAQDQSFRWFVWYMISDDEIMIDSGSTEIADCVDIRQVVDFVNNNDSCRGIVTAKITDKGSLRLKAAIPYGDEKAFVDKWVDVDSTLNVIWHTVYLVGKEQEKNLRREAERRTAAESERQARYDNDDDDDDDEYRTETSGRCNSSASAERERKAEEKRRKEEAKRRKAEKIARLQSRIKDAEGNLVTYYNNIESLKRNPTYNAERIDANKAEIARRKAVIKGYKDEIARIRREE